MAVGKPTAAQEIMRTWFHQEQMKNVGGNACPPTGWIMVRPAEATENETMGARKKESGYLPRLESTAATVEHITPF